MALGAVLRRPIACQGNSTAQPRSLMAIHQVSCETSCRIFVSGGVCDRAILQYFQRESVLVMPLTHDTRLVSRATVDIDA